VANKASISAVSHQKFVIVLSNQVIFCSILSISNKGLSKYCSVKLSGNCAFIINAFAWCPQSCQVYSTLKALFEIINTSLPFDTWFVHFMSRFSQCSSDASAKKVTFLGCDSTTLPEMVVLFSRRIDTLLIKKEKIIMLV